MGSTWPPHGQTPFADRGIRGSHLIHDSWDCFWVEAWPGRLPLCRSLEHLGGTNCSQPWAHAWRRFNSELEWRERCKLPDSGKTCCLCLLMPVQLPSQGLYTGHQFDHLCSTLGVTTLVKCCKRLSTRFNMFNGCSNMFNEIERIQSRCFQGAAVPPAPAGRWEAASSPWPLPHHRPHPAWLGTQHWF